MKHLPRHKLLSAAAKWLCALLAAMALPSNAFAQPKSPERWLFIFDLSPTMKKRLPATEEVLKNFFATGAEGRLQDGDNIGVWTYDQKMHDGQFPLVIWKPEQATALTTNLTAFLRSRHFTDNSRLAALQPVLGSVIASSERLTIIIFCDGESEIGSTPYDSGINQNFLDNRAERKKSGQPFVVLIRTLSGKYIGCTVNFPPGTINIPLFLAPPTPTKTPPPPPVVAHVKPAPLAVPDLVIIGTNVGANATLPPKPPPPAVKLVPVMPPKIVENAANPAPAPVPPPAPATNLVPTNSIHPVVMTAPASEVPPPKTIALVSNVVAKPEIPAHSNIAAAVVIPPVTNHAMTPQPAKVETPVAVQATNSTTTATTNGDTGQQTRRLVFIGVGLLATAIVLVVVLLVRPGRRPQSSLITSSMQDDPRRK